MAPVKRHAYEADFKLKAISYEVTHGNRAAAREFTINKSMVQKRKKQEDELRHIKKTKQSFRVNKVTPLSASGSWMPGQSLSVSSVV